MTKDKNMICTIPARGGSKRLPKKNILPLVGKPMIAYSIETAMKSSLFEEVYICTNDDEIATIAKQYGAKVPFLMSQDLCGDLIPSHIPCQKMAEFFINEGKKINTIVCLQPTSPLRSIEDLIEAIQIFFNQDYDFLVSITSIDPHYFHWAVQKQDNRYWKMYFGNQYMKERLLLPSVYRPNGSIKIANLEKLREVGHFFGSKLGVIETPEERSIHVATQFEFDLCQFLLKRSS